MLQRSLAREVCQICPPPPEERRVERRRQKLGARGPLHQEHCCPAGPCMSSFLFIHTDYSLLTVVPSRYVRKPVVAHTVHTVVSTPTRVTLVTWRSSSQHPTPRLSGRRTKTSLPLRHSLVSTGGRSPVDELRQRGLRRFPPSLHRADDGRYQVRKLLGGVMLFARDAAAVCRCLHMYAYAMSPKPEANK